MALPRLVFPAQALLKQRCYLYGASLLLIPVLIMMLQDADTGRNATTACYWNRCGSLGCPMGYFILDSRVGWTGHCAIPWSESHRCCRKADSLVFKERKNEMYHSMITHARDLGGDTTVGSTTSSPTSTGTNEAEAYVPAALVWTSVLAIPFALILLYYLAWCCRWVGPLSRRPSSVYSVEPAFEDEDGSDISKVESEDHRQSNSISCKIEKKKRKEEEAESIEQERDLKRRQEELAIQETSREVLGALVDLTARRLEVHARAKRRKSVGKKDVRNDESNINLLKMEHEAARRRLRAELEIVKLRQRQKALRKRNRDNPKRKMSAYQNLRQRTSRFFNAVAVSHLKRINEDSVQERNKEIQRQRQSQQRKIQRRRQYSSKRRTTMRALGMTGRRLLDSAVNRIFPSTPQFD